MSDLSWVAPLLAELPAWPTLAAIALVIVLGTFLQGSIGIGLGLIASPLLALLDASFVPGPLLASATLLVLLMVVRDHRSIHFQGVGWALAGRLPGTIVGALAVATFTGALLEMTLGGLILICVIASGIRWQPRVSRTSLLAAGLVSGVSGTATAVGGPPVALVLQNEQAARLRATMAGYFLVGTTLSLASLAWVGKFGRAELLRVGLLVPAVLVGFALSCTLARRLEGVRLRPMILAVSGASALVLLLRGLSGN